MEVPPDNLKATVERYNEMARKGYDEDFHKNPKFLFPIEKPPFYAGRFKSALLVIVGGFGQLMKKCRFSTKMMSRFLGCTQQEIQQEISLQKIIRPIFPGVSVSRAIISPLAGQNAG